MSLPAQIQAQVEEAKNIIEQHYGVPEGDEAGTAKPDETPEQVPEQKPSSEPAATQQAEDENSETYAQRWRSLQGIYNSQVGTLKSENAQLQGRLSQLEQLISSLPASQPAQTQAQPQQQVPRFLTEKDSEEYGADMIDLVRRTTREELLPFVGALEALRAELGTVRGVVPQVQQIAVQQRQTKDDQFFDALTQRLPAWRQANNDPRFHAWLLAADPATGITRQTYLEDAHHSHDVGRVAYIFETWMQLEGVPTKQPSSTGPNPAKSELEKQVAPGRTVSTVPVSTSSQGKTWTRAEIMDFYNKKLQGGFKGNEAEYARIEKDIFLAQREGRIAGEAA